MRATVLVIIALMLIAALVFAEHSPPNANLPVVNADFQSCVTVLPGPLKPRTKPILNRNLSENA
jgi:hypothetical protein